MRNIQEKVEKDETKPKKKSRKTPVKPKGFRDFETLAKGILEAEGVSYFEWLHEQHQEIILTFNLSNKNKIAKLAGEDD